MHTLLFIKLEINNYVSKFVTTDIYTVATYILDNLSYYHCSHVVLIISDDDIQIEPFQFINWLYNYLSILGIKF